MSQLPDVFDAVSYSRFVKGCFDPGAVLEDGSVWLRSTSGPQDL